MQDNHGSAGSDSLANALSDKRRNAVIEIFGEHFLKTFESPIVFLDDWKLESNESNRFFRKDFAYLSTTLYQEYRYRTWREFNPELLVRFEELIASKLTNINTLMTNWIRRIQHLLEQNNHSTDTTLFPTQRIVTVPIISGHARSYMLMLRNLDTVINLAGTANMYGVLASAQRAEAEYTCKKAVRAFRTIMQNEITKLWREASRVVAAQQASGKAVSKEIATMVEAQGKRIKDFDAEAKSDSEADGTAGADNADPSQTIDNALAASNAAAAAAASPNKPRRTKPATKPTATAGA